MSIHTPRKRATTILKNRNREPTTKKKATAKRQPAVRNGHLYNSIISASEVYSVAAFSMITGFSREKIWDMRHSGLKIHRVGRNFQILGSDYIDWLKQQPVEESLGSHETETEDDRPEV